MGQPVENTTVNLLGGASTRVSGQAALPGLQSDIGYDAIKLTAKHEEFCWQYLAKCGNGTSAYLAVYPGIKETTARVNASKLLTNTTIMARIAEIQAEKRRGNSLLTDKVIDYHAKVMTLDRTALLNEDRTGVKDFGDMPSEAVDVLEFEQVSSAQGVRTLLKIPQRHQSAVELARILGLHKDKVELTGKDGGPVEHTIGGLLNELMGSTRELVEAVPA